MILRNPKLLRKTLASARQCELCGDAYRARHVHHIYSVGSGRVDIDAALVVLCWVCHANVHNGAVSREQLLGIAACREGLLPEEITQAVMEIRRWPREKPLPERLAVFVK